MSEETPIMDQLFIEWVGEENKQMLYEILAYASHSDYPIHSLFAFIGSGRNGKSRYLELINRFIGKSNVTSTELDDLLENRFEKTKLYKKLVCVMGETNFGTIKKSSLIKKLTGQDLIGFELKNKNPFDDYNYAKIIISSNSLPSSDDTSDGFYRRWIIIRFPNEFKEGKDILEKIPLIEYSNLAKKIIRILRELLDRSSFCKQGSIEQRKQNYIMASNPLTIFIKDFCVIDESKFIKYSELYTYYSQYLLKHKQRVVSKMEFGNILNSEGYHVDKTSKQINGEWVNSRWILGLSIDLPKFVTFVTFVLDISLNSSRVGGELESEARKAQKAQERNEGIDTLFSFGELQNILIEKSDGWSFVDAIKFGFVEKDLEKWVVDGLIFENPSGIFRLV
jgi:P4 family phage/plasmid primase-like protien